MVMESHGKVMEFHFLISVGTLFAIWIAGIHSASNCRHNHAFILQYYITTLRFTQSTLSVRGPTLDVIIIVMRL